MAKIKIKNGEKKVIAEFQADPSVPLSSQATDEGVMVTVACGTGVCGLCVMTVESGEEFLDGEKFGSKGIPVEEGKVFSCIAGVRDDAPEDAEIILVGENL